MNDTTTPQRVKTADLGDGVRLITLDNPPVNALGYALCGDLVPLVEAADKDASVSTVIFTGANGMFSGGADVNDFTTPPTAESRRSTATRSAAASSSRWRATTASRRRSRGSACRRSSWACCPAPAARSASRA